MKAILYIHKGPNEIQFGMPARVSTLEDRELSRDFIRRVIVTLPDGYTTGTPSDGSPITCIFNEKKVMADLSASKSGDPVIFDPIRPGAFICFPKIEDLPWEKEVPSDLE